jgi:hypothetical protein
VLGPIEGPAVERSVCSGCEMGCAYPGTRHSGELTPGAAAMDCAGTVGRGPLHSDVRNRLGERAFPRHLECVVAAIRVNAITAVDPQDWVRPQR